MHAFITYIYKETDINTLCIAKTEASQEKPVVRFTDEGTNNGFCSTHEMRMINS